MSEDKQIIVAEAIQPTAMQVAIPSTATVQAVWQLAELAAKSGMVKSNKPSDAFFIAMYGIELGIPPMTALRTIHSVNGGAPTCSGEALLSLMRRSGKVKLTLPNIGEISDSATITIERLDTGEKQSFTYTVGMATKAGLINKDNWKKHRPMMLFWRSVGMGSKAMCSDITGGLYTTEEMSPDTQIDETGMVVGEVVESEVAEEKPIIENGANHSIHLLSLKHIQSGNKAFITIQNDLDIKASVWSRELLVNAGWLDRDTDLLNPGDEIKYTEQDCPTGIITYKDGWWTLTSVTNTPLDTAIPQEQEPATEDAFADDADLVASEGDLGYYGEVPS